MLKLQVIFILFGCATTLMAATFFEWGRIINPSSTVRETSVVVSNQLVRQAIMTSSDMCLKNTAYDPSNIMMHFTSSPARQSGWVAVRSLELNACFITETWNTYDELITALNARNNDVINLDLPTYYNTSSRWNFDYAALKTKSNGLADFCKRRAIFNVNPFIVYHPWGSSWSEWRSSASWFIVFNRLFPVGGSYLTEYLCSDDYRLRRNTHGAP